VGANDGYLKARELRFVDVSLCLTYYFDVRKSIIFTARL